LRIIAVPMMPMPTMPTRLAIPSSRTSAADQQTAVARPSARAVLFAARRHPRFDRSRRSWLLCGLFVPNEVITTRITCLACAYRASVVYAAADPYLEDRKSVV